MDRDILLEALSVLTGTLVKALTELKPGEKAEMLTLDNFLPAVFSNPEAKKEDPETWPYMLGLLYQAVNMNRQTVRDRKNENVSSTTSAQTPPTKETIPPLSDKQQEKTSESTTLRRKVFVDMDTFFDPEHDYDFSKLKKDSVCSRGGEMYRRPRGYYRFALKVKDKYPGGNAWLGSGGWRSQSDPGEWPVSFHGTNIEGARGIASSNYRAGERMVYGRGVYSTPDITIAEKYAMQKTFTSKKNKKTYRTIMQNRINPAARIKTSQKGYWLIQVPDNTQPEEEKKIVETSIRPYGILVKEV